MIELVNGPAAGAYAVKRAPLYLRAVLDTVTGAKDVLDKLDDTPGDDEEVCVYKRDGEVGAVHLNFGRRGATGFYATGRYHWLADVVGAEVCDTMAWRKWVAGRLPGGVDLETGVMP